MIGKTATLNRVLGLTGFELRRRGHTIATLKSRSRRQTAGWMLEVIGTRGIGKTTLNNALCKHLQENWFFRSDLGQTGPVTSSLGEIEKQHRDIYFAKINRLQEEQTDTWDSITITRQMSRVISESLTILTNDFPRGFVMDEGLFKNFPHEVLKIAGEAPGPLWRKRAFVHMRTRDPDFVISRYQSRVAERARRGMMQVPPSDDAVRTRVKEDNRLFGIIAERAQAFGCPLVIIHAEDDMQDNIDRILALEKTIRAGAQAEPGARDTS